MADAYPINHTQALKQGLHDFLGDHDRAIELRQKFREEASQTVSERFPEAKEYLKERLAIRIWHRKTSFLYWWHREDEEKGSDKKTMTLTESDPLDSKTGGTKPSGAIMWRNKDGSPKPPKSDSSQSHFVCPICFLSTPSEEANGDLWIQHVIRDLKPYVCLIESCKTPQITSSTFEEWIQHMKDHQEGSTLEVFTCCPLCSHDSKRDVTEPRSALTDQELLQQHVSHHLHSLALTTLPLPPSISEPQPERSDLSRGVPRSRVHVPQPMFPIANQVHPPPLETSIRGIQSGFTQEINSVPRKYDYRFAAQPSLVASTPSQPLAPFWGSHENQAPNTETFDILVAEDNIVNQKIFTKMLQKRQHMVIVANNGQEAFDSIKRRKFDLILMDLQMPIMGGCEAAGRIREYECNFGIPRTPIIALTAYMPASSETLLQAEMDDVSYKPVRAKELYEMVTRYGRLGRSVAGDDFHQYLASISGGRQGVGYVKPVFRAKI